ncbi:MAG: DUF2933 domain-containing protein [Sporomusaceae bacterium]|nr:DUF2933 domain-containing protein [Sporomusaceae bacterium]
MGCCKQSQSSNTTQGQQQNCGNSLKHMLMMFVCCLTPIAAVLLLKLSGYEGTASYLVFLLCPLVHLFMMKGMGHKKQEQVDAPKAAK